MKAIVAIIGAISLLCPYLAWGQGTAMYDSTYRGPVNGFGQPAYTVMPRQQQQAPQPGQRQPQGVRYPGISPQQMQGMGTPQRPGGLVGAAYSGFSRAGSYFWGYLPAPLRGPQAQYQSPEGDVSIINVPGTQ
jgi:hypothetical protein